jgi:dUTP pyrophosphatase
MPPVYLERLDAAAAIPERQTRGSFGFDLATIIPETVQGRETRILPCGWQLARDLPHDDTRGLALMILPRSSLPLKFGLILPNSPGLVDADYAEPIGIIVHNLRDEPVTLPAGTRIAQAVFVELRFPVFCETDESDGSRTRGGFGSTGH